jgi:hypothetical protein
MELRGEWRGAVNSGVGSDASSVTDTLCVAVRSPYPTPVTYRLVTAYLDIEEPRSAASEALRQPNAMVAR